MKLLSLGLIALLAGCHPPGPPVPPSSRSDPVVQEGYIEAGSGVRLFYRLVGNRGDTVIVLHGGPGFTMDFLRGSGPPEAQPVAPE